MNRGLRTTDEAAPLAFGSAVHKGLEHWYSLPVSERALPASLVESCELYPYGHDLHTAASQGAQEAIRQFVLARYEVLKGLGEADKRSLHNGVKILQAYFKRYADDGLEVARDDKGPIIEREVEFAMLESPALDIRYFGTIDVVLRNIHTGVLLVTDHKTTAALGQEFYNRCKPNPQYTGYVLAARQCLGLDTSLFMINGIQVAKTKHEFARQVTSRTEEDFFELRSSVEETVHRWLNASAVAERYAGNAPHLAYPMTSPNPCAAYGGCQFLKVCEVPTALKESVIKATWEVGA